MSYTVLARRYRATTFSGVIGQEAIAQTLKNAIDQGRVGHAYLFTGTRGVGKTSMARIFAAALNAPATIDDCPQPSETDQDAYPELEVQQRMTDAIRRGDDLNVIEIDGASNNSVDQARQLIANAGLSPSSGARYKVYIIDEVHMLSTAAFNALLKTMEEPPSHVKFILCTTEPHKVPPTVQSRCQRFDFRSITTTKIAEHLTAIINEEKLGADPQIAWRVASLGNGSMRDALSLLDRMIAGAQDSGDGQRQLDIAGLEQMLGLPSEELVINLIDALADGQMAQALEQTAQILAGGISQDQLITVLIERLRQLMLIAACGPDSGLVELSIEAQTRAADQSKKFDAPGLVYMIALCENLQNASKRSANARAILDATVVRLALAEKMADVTALLSGNTPKASVGAISTGSKKKLKPPAPLPDKPSPAPPATPPAPTQHKTPEASNSAAVINAVDFGNDTNKIWSALVSRVQDRPAISSWITKLKLKQFDGRVASVVNKPGQRDILNFVSEQRRGQLAELLTTLLNRPVVVNISTGSAVEEEGNTTSASDTASPDRDKVSGLSNHPSFDRRPPLDEKSKRQAMELPLVRAAVEVLDATLVEVVRTDGSID